MNTDLEITNHVSGSVMTPVEKLKPYHRNNRAHGDEQIALLAKNIRALGWRWPIIVSKRSGYIVAGHGRLEAAKLLGVSSVPVVEQDFPDGPSEEAFRLADNRIPELAEIQKDTIRDLLSELGETEIDMDLTGYTEPLIKEIISTDKEKTDDEVGSADARIIVRLSFSAMSWIGCREEVLGIIDRMIKKYECKASVDE